MQFYFYKKIDPIEIKSASGKSKLFGMGQATLLIENGISVTAYHAPEFESNIVCPRLLAKIYDVPFSEHFRHYSACFFFASGSHNVIAEYPLKDLKYPMRINSDTTAPAVLPLRIKP